MGRQRDRPGGALVLEAPVHLSARSLAMVASEIGGLQHGTRPPTLRIFVRREPRDRDRLRHDARQRPLSDRSREWTTLDRPAGWRYLRHC